jgi:hypothetical protein
MFRNTLRPLIFANHRNLAVTDVVTPGNRATLERITYTIATSAVNATRQVLYNKAVRVNRSTLALFGELRQQEKFEFPAVTTLLINSAGPIERARESYRVNFVPYITSDEVDQLYQQDCYDPAFEETFGLAMSRAHYSLRMTEVDIYNEISSHWWTTYMEGFDPHNVHFPNNATLDYTHFRRVNAYQPMSFRDLDDATAFACISLEETLYDLPGPCFTSEVGPFVVAMEHPTFNDIPPHFREDIAINKSPPVRLTTFTPREQITHADAVHYGRFQGDRALFDAAHPSVLDPNVPLNNWRNAMTTAVEACLNPDPSAGTVARPGTSPTRPSQNYVAPPAPHVVAPEALVVGTQYRKCKAISVYFDHVLLRGYETKKTAHRISEANKPK